MTENTFNFVNRIALAAGKRAEDYGLQALTAPEQTVMLIWWAVGIIGNGGFQYFYEGATEMVEVADSFDRLGLGEAATACRTSLNVFPNATPPADQNARCELLDTIQDEDHTLFEQLDNVIWDVNDNDLDGKLARYIETNRASFRDLPE